ncbi:SDR family oxidoreductase [Brevundimonas sp.]|uniref:SDR family NAD(P)-dependent oxidoreductase n=1 Tax=Brevundimonas sp. TaxID=1871086 RepID=UPI001A18563A|nr:SDR family oxidoreductase [Brevundimonas sp.]MBJ7483315.1 SDR family oxidoreductase [Brevundimonas sp.]
MSIVSVAGRRIIVTGGASGMGQALVQAFPGLGASVVSIDLSAEAGEAIAREAGAVGFEAADVADEASIQGAIDRAADTLGGLDVLIHAAGVATGGAAATTTLDVWNRVMAVNATGTFLVNRAAFPHLKDHGGAILNFASAAGVRGHPTKAAYAAAKGAVVAWTRTIAAEWGRYGISANCIAPAIWTPMYDRTRADMTVEDLADHDATKARTIPLGGRLGDVERDFVPAMAFLASPGARFISGQIIPIDGGMLMVR